MIYKAPTPDGKHVSVTFELPSSIWAERVNLVGDFNDWDSTRHEMRQSRVDGNWRITLELPVGAEYQFRYLVNGHDWHNDWHADKYVSNEYGTDNSVVCTHVDE
jgi:1,4-alpha-glucan branching enzyme